MKRIYNICIIALAAILTQFLLSCSTDYETDQKTMDFKDLKFIINVDDMSTTRAASDGKTGWTENDEIILAVDGKNDNLCMIKYDGKTWGLTSLSNSVNFKDSGRLNAVFADKITYSSGSITTFGDILYTQNGTYTKSGDVIVITLSMNQRPLAKIKVNGLPEGFWIDGLLEFTSLNISDITWTATSSKGKNCSEKEDENKYTFYGLLDANGGNTTIKFINEKGAYYKKTFVGKTIKAGDYINISGPKASSGWDSMVPLEGLKATSEAKMIVGGIDKIYNYFEYLPSDATTRDVEFSSSNSSIVTIDASGNMKAHSVGEANITVKSKNYGYTCTVKVKVINIENYVSVQLTGVGTTVSNGGIYYSRTYTIKNSSPVDIYLLSISTSNSISINETLKAGNSRSITLYLNYNVYPQVTVKFKYGDTTYSVTSN